MDLIDQAIKEANHEDHEGNGYTLTVRSVTGDLFRVKVFYREGKRILIHPPRDGASYRGSIFFNPDHIASVSVNWC